MYQKGWSYTQTKQKKIKASSNVDQERKKIFVFQIFHV